MAIKFFENVAGVLSMDMREIVLACLKKLSRFLEKFDRLVLSPKQAISNIESNHAAMPDSFFKVGLELFSESTDIKMYLVN